jgi:hypothetical protein
MSSKPVTSTNGGHVCRAAAGRAKAMWLTTPRIYRRATSHAADLLRGLRSVKDPPSALTGPLAGAIRLCLSVRGDS